MPQEKVEKTLHFVFFTFFSARQSKMRANVMVTFVASGNQVEISTTSPNGLNKKARPLDRYNLDKNDLAFLVNPL